MQNDRDQDFRGRYKGSIRNCNFDRDWSRSRQRLFLGILGDMIEVAVDKDQVPEQVPIDME